MQSLVTGMCLVALPFAPTVAVAQAPADSTAIPCKHCMAYTSAGLGSAVVGTVVLLDKAWYADYPRGPLRAFNDGAEWAQMDKYGHVFSAYTLSAWGHGLFRRCKPGGRAGLWLGTAFSMAFMSGVEVLDGTSAEWGFSWWDMAANATGASLYLGQELRWGEQRIRLKLSARHTDYALQRPDLLGQAPVERYLKDYNGQTIWLSVSPGAFHPKGKWPAWLNVAAGVGAEGMVTAFPSGPADMRQQRFLLSPDVDLTRIRTRSKALRTLLFVLNSIKVPAPALEVKGTGQVRGHWLYF